MVHRTQRANRIHRRKETRSEGKGQGQGRIPGRTEQDTDTSGIQALSSHSWRERERNWKLERRLGVMEIEEEDEDDSEGEEDTVRASRDFLI